MEETLDTNTQSTFSDGPKNLPNATASLVLGIISIASCWLYGLPGVITGIIALVLHSKDKKLYLTDPTAYAASYKNSNAGKICAIIGLSISSLFLIYIIFILAIFGTVFLSAANAGAFR
jgi:hypothetical protein